MHPALEEMRGLIAEGEPEEALETLLPFIASQLGPDAERARKRRFSGYRDEALLHASGLARLATRKRQRLDDPDRLELEDRRITASITALITEIDRALARGAAPVVAPGMSADLAEAVPEKVVGRGNLQPIAWLARGEAVGQAVCRVLTPTTIGSGFLLASGQVITNNHVVPDKATAARTTVEFGFERDAQGQLKQPAILPIRETGFYTLPAPLDCSVLSVDATAEALSAWGGLSLSPKAVPKKGDPVAIIQHPNGGEKQIAVTANEVIALDGGRIAYLTDTLGGSSGAPVFDETWQVVALHRAGGALIPTDAGRHLRANEGVLFQKLLCDPGFRAAIGM